MTKRLYKIFFSHDLLINDIIDRKFRAIYILPIFFSMIFIFALWQPFTGSEVTDRGFIFLAVLAVIFVVYVLYSLWFSNRDVFLLLFSCIAFSISLVRFLLFSLILIVIEYPIHISLIKLQVLNANSLENPAYVLLPIVTIYLYYILLSFLYQHNNRVIKSDEAN